MNDLELVGSYHHGTKSWEEMRVYYNPNRDHYEWLADSGVDRSKEWHHIGDPFETGTREEAADAVMQEFRARRGGLGSTDIYELATKVRKHEPKK